MLRLAVLPVIAGALALAGCVVAPPTGPTITALPGKGKSLEAFQRDDATCRQYASQAIGYGSPAEAAQQSAVNSAALGTVLGAAAGAALGAATGNPAAGAAFGAGSGLLVGGASGANAAQYSAATLQQQYDRSYAQCMYASGNSVPANAGAASAYAYYPYAYPYPYPYPYPPVYGPPVSIGLGFGFGGHRHWR